MFWVEEAALARWQAPRRSTPGGQPRYSESAVELVLTLRLVFHKALRQAEGPLAASYSCLVWLCRCRTIPPWADGDAPWLDASRAC